ncbi:hypothetical protein L1987_73711 [Smallanthus sonchifolius]|uniref:Uncharacterized protein n=1 Tax=Smallanthus sonchifolius TaxID=185202 RepID=A0ACB9A572_9ASTR|nr:hypothetical protein L1987_73711 [Smallanthus sonchifolius]
MTGFTVWPGISPVLIITGFELTGGNSRSFQLPDDWSGSLWGRTGCTFNGSGHGSCKIGDCGSGEMECNGRSATPPVTVAEFGTNKFGERNFDVSVMDGYNLQMTVEATTDGSTYLSGDCLKRGCFYDLNKRCPEELMLKGGGGCHSPCQVFRTPEYCCYNSCEPTSYSRLFSSACPRTDDISSSYCEGANYTVRFCPRPFSTIKLGIWYTSDAEARKVWVANPNKPIIRTSDGETIALSIDRNTGNLMIIQPMDLVGGKTLMKITDVQAGPNPNVTATLEDTGNFRLINEIDKRVLWQSFDHPTNVLLPGMKLGYDKRTRQNWTLTSSHSDDIFDSGAFTLSWEPIDETNQRLMIRRRGQPYWTGGFPGIKAFGGYMFPEYAMEGTFSIKYDIYSFGVLILEILSGRRNSSFVHLDRTVNLLGYAWELWQQGNALELEDPTLRSTYVVHQFLRTFHVALLCVQESALDRPTTSDMVSMLLNDTISLPAPKRPAFFTRGVESKSTLDHISSEECSANNVTVSVIEGR